MTDQLRELIDLYPELFADAILCLQKWRRTSQGDDEDAFDRACSDLHEAARVLCEVLPTAQVME